VVWVTGIVFAEPVPLNFSKEKRKKRKSSYQWRFQKKSSFFEKILPDTLSEMWA
jgi:hypothetical protein